jgi:Rap1a immunity proteins
MKWMTRVAWVALALLAGDLSGASPAEAFETGRDLAHACGDNLSSERVIGNALCLGYIAGFVDAYRVSLGLLERHAPTVKPPICLPSHGVQKGQVMGLVNEWLKRTPADHDQSARVVLWSVLSTAYPCS